MGKTLVIAEMGSTHEKELQRIFNGIEVAANCGADVVKLQWISSAGRLAGRRNALEYLQAYQKIAFPREWHPLIVAKCKKHRIQYGCSVFLPEDVEEIGQWVDLVKISSFEAADFELVSKVIYQCREHVIPLVISLGGRGRNEARQLLWKLKRIDGFADIENHVHFLHCISAYPTSIQDAQLHCLSTYGKKVYAGFSDHTLSLLSGAVAVGCGATVIEKHFRLQNTPTTNADYAVSLLRDALESYIDNIREAELLYGDEDSERYMPGAEELLKPFQLPPGRYLEPQQGALGYG